jgi:hypothetical protein
MPAEIAQAPAGSHVRPASWRGELWRTTRVYRLGLVIFAVSRLVVVLGINLGNFIPPRVDPFPWSAGPAWYFRLLRWDSGWYGAIARSGYQYNGDPSPQSSIVFYPLYPLLSRAVVVAFGVSVDVALLLVANAASLVAVLLMTKFVKDEVGDEVALLSLSCFCFFPFSLFLSAGYTEPLLLVLVLSSLILLARQRYAPASLLAGLAAATRPTGIVMLPVILWEMWRRRTTSILRLLPRIALCGLLAASGLLIYMAYLWYAFGQPLAFAAGQAGWHHEAWSDRLLSALTLGPFRRSPLHDDLLVSEIAFVSFLVLTIWSFRRLAPAAPLYGLGALLLPYATLGIYTATYRFVLVCIPAFMMMGLILHGRPRLARAVIGTFAVLLLAVSALYSQWYCVG